MAGKVPLVALAVVAGMLAGGVLADGAKHTCSFTANQLDKACEVIMAAKDEFTLSCASNTEVIPGELMGAEAAAKACSSAKPRTAVAEACKDLTGSSVLLSSLESKGIASSTFIKDIGFTLTNNGYKGTTDLYISGSCKKSTTDSLFFSLKFPKVSSGDSTNGGGGGGGNSSATGTRVGLATATGVALLALATF